MGWSAPNCLPGLTLRPTEQAATVALAESQAEKKPPAPKRALSFFRSHSHHQHSPCSAMGMALGTCFPHTPLQGHCFQCMHISVLRWL